VSDYDFAKPSPVDRLAVLPGDPPALARYLARQRRARTVREAGERQNWDSPVTDYIPGDLDHLDGPEPPS
jgi:hypothetical protein